MRTSVGVGLIVLAVAGVACGGVCENGTAEGSVWIRTQDELSAMAGCKHVKGHLVIHRVQSADLAGLESLTTVDGKLNVHFSDVLSDISALAGVTSVGSGHLQGGSELSIDGNPMLRTISFPALTSLSSHLWISGAGLTSVDFPALTSITGGLSVMSTDRLTSLAGLGTVTSLGGTLMVQGNTALVDTAGLSGLTEVGADLMVQENAALTTLTLPALTSVGASEPSPTDDIPFARQLYVAVNAALTRIDLPALTFVGAGGVRVWNNPALAQCQADAIAIRAGKTCECGGNAGTGTCP